MITPDGWKIASNSQGNCVGARRVPRSHDVQICETDNPNHVIQLSETGWIDFLARVASGELRPTNVGRYAVVPIPDRMRRREHTLVTTVANWHSFVSGVEAGKFNDLPHAPIGLAAGPWTTRHSGAASVAR